MALGPRPGGGGSGEANTTSTEGGQLITLPKDGDNLPFKGPSSLSDSDVKLTPQAALIEHDLKPSPKNAIRHGVIGGITKCPAITVVDGATTFDQGAGELELVDYSVDPPVLRTVTIPENTSDSNCTHWLQSCLVIV